MSAPRSDEAKCLAFRARRAVGLQRSTVIRCLQMTRRVPSSISGTRGLPTRPNVSNERRIDLTTSSSRLTSMPVSENIPMAATPLAPVPAMAAAVSPSLRRSRGLATSRDSRLPAVRRDRATRSRLALSPTQTSFRRSNSPTLLPLLPFQLLESREPTGRRQIEAARSHARGTPGGESLRR